jgi:hypothetical protein
MRLTLPATKILSCCLLVCLGETKQSIPKDVQLLDLTTIPPSERRSLGVPGSSGGGTSDGRSLGPPLYDLPLKVRIEKTELRHGPSAYALRLWIEFVNADTARFQFPSCVDELKAHGDSQIGRRTFAFRLEFSGQNLKVPVTTAGEVTFAATSIPECSISLAPGARIQVLLEIPVPSGLQTPSTKPNEMKISVLCDEFTLENNRFQVGKQSREIRSNSVALPDPS